MAATPVDAVAIWKVVQCLTGMVLYTAESSTKANADSLCLVVRTWMSGGASCNAPRRKIDSCWEDEPMAGQQVVIMRDVAEQIP